MAILDLKASVFGLNWSEFHQKNKLNKAKPSQGKTAAQVEKTSTFNDKIVKKKIPQFLQVLPPISSPHWTDNFKNTYPMK